jgi:hypothetical protein
MTDRFATALDCVDVTFLPDGILDELPVPSQIGATRVGGIDLNKPRIRQALAAVLALSAAPGGFTVADLAAKVRAMTGQADYTIRQAAYDLRKLRDKRLVDKPAAHADTTSPHLPPAPSRPCSPSATRSSPPSSPASVAPAWDAKPAWWTAVDRDYETSASACRPSSTTSASPPPLQPRPPHRQLFVDGDPSSA